MSIKMMSLGINAPRWTEQSHTTERFLYEYLTVHGSVFLSTSNGSTTRCYHGMPSIPNNQ